LRTFGGFKQIIDGAGASIQPIGPDVALQKALARARRWAAQLASGERTGADDIAAVEGLQSRYVDKVLRLAWLAPEIVAAVLSGGRMRDCSLTELMDAKIPMDWERQRLMMSVI
jgi:site-specific DNA recombinase